MLEFSGRTCAIWQRQQIIKYLTVWHSAAADCKKMPAKSSIKPLGTSFKRTEKKCKITNALKEIIINKFDKEV